MDDNQLRRPAEDRPSLPGLGNARPEAQILADWQTRIADALAAGLPEATAIAEAAVRENPYDGKILLLATVTMLVANNTDRAFTLLKRLDKHFVSSPMTALVSAIAYAQRGTYPRAAALLDRYQLGTMTRARSFFPLQSPVMLDWLSRQLADIRRTRKLVVPAKPLARKKAAPAIKPVPAIPTPPPLPSLPRLTANFATEIIFANPNAICLDGMPEEFDWYRLRGELTQLGLFQGFDELLCLPGLHDVEPLWYQVETVRKVLKQYRGRVLLADEVGLGKTIEAGMVVKEYMLRGMADRLLILVPAALVGQWREEMTEKFGIGCASTHDPLLRADPAAFWAQKRVIASTAVARRKEHAGHLAALSYDVVVVDEAHHLRDQASASYKLVNSLQKRFLLLLSATPVQNNLIELYNLLTLLQPGIFKTPKEFRAAYMVPGKPREPVNREKLRDLMRGVMIRNTRALAALRLPRRHAATLRATPALTEAECYRTLTELARQIGAGGQRRLAVQHLLTAAGSSPAAAVGAITRFIESHPTEKQWGDLLKRYRAVEAGAKQDALLELLIRNPAEKKMVFVHHRDSMTHLAQLLRKRKIQYESFDGSMTGPEKDAAVAAFRGSVPILLCSESGGEGRNLQFCNTLINFDIPWNPMAIEQRIGRIDRIGQTREVFVFNLATSGTIEDQVLRILDEKINMFELVVGEVGVILGELDEQQDFSNLVLDAWLQQTEEARQAAFAALEAQLTTAQRQYQGAKQLDEALFGNELDAG